MKLALCLEYPIGQFGGTEILVQELIRGLAPHHELLLVSDDTTAAIEQSPWKKFLAGHLRWYPAMRGRFRQIYHSRLHEPAPSLEPERTKNIICIGTIGPRKGQTYLTEAFCEIAERHTDWSLVLIGRNGDAAMMERIQSLR